MKRFVAIVAGTLVALALTAGFALAHLAVGPLSDAMGRRRTAAAFMAAVAIT